MEPDLWLLVNFLDLYISFYLTHYSVLRTGSDLEKVVNRPQAENCSNVLKIVWFVTKDKEKHVY